MTTIKATCPACGEIELTAEQIRLVVCSLPNLSYYAFDCASCATEVRKPADKNVVSLLISGGVTATRWRIPAEWLEEKTGPAISYDDLLDFALKLGRIEHLAAFARPRQVA
ncbi:MAG: hypothetical protein WCB04_04210 [Mycobacteriales bacterium]